MGLIADGAEFHADWPKCNGISDARLRLPSAALSYPLALHGYSER